MDESKIREIVEIISKFGYMNVSVTTNLQLAGEYEGKHLLKIKLLIKTREAAHIDIINIRDSLKSQEDIGEILFLFMKNKLDGDTVFKAVMNLTENKVYDVVYAKEEK